jgi:hypothetical protein
MTFKEYLQKYCGGYSLREILDNIEEHQIEEAVQDYVQQQVKNLNIPAVIKSVCVKCDTDMLWNGLLYHWFCPKCKIQVKQTVL